LKSSRLFDASSDSLGGLALLQGADSVEIASLLAGVEVRIFAAGEQVLAAGAPNAYLYVVLSGRLRVSITPGERRAAPIVERGECVGELSVIDGALTSAAVTAESDSELLALDSARVHLLADRSHPVARNLLRLLSGRLRGTNRLLLDEANRADSLQASTITDPTTGLYSRNWLDSTLERLAQRAGQGGAGFSVLLMDIDHFAMLNQNLGRARGDRALALAAMALRSGLRPTDQAARFGGDEFAVLLPGAVSIGVATAIGERACAALRLVRDPGLETLRLTCSAGTAVHMKGDTPIQLLERALKALDQAKLAGGNRVAGA